MNVNLPEVKGHPTVIFFDAAGTLIRLAQPAGWHYADIARRQNVIIPPSEMEQAFRRAWKDQAPRISQDGPRLDDDRNWWKSLAISALRKASPTLPSYFDISAWFHEVYERFAEPGVWELYEDALPCLERLSPVFRLAVISNFDRRLLGILKDLKIDHFFEKIVISSEVGSDKPDARIFSHALAAMKVAPNTCLHVGDDPERDKHGAESVGIAAFLLERPSLGLDLLYP